MGLDLSRLTQGKRWIQCPQWRDILFRPRSDFYACDKYTVEYSDLVQAWQVVHEEPLDKWKKSQSKSVCERSVCVCVCECICASSCMLVYPCLRMCLLVGIRDAKIGSTEKCLTIYMNLL